MHIEKGTRKGVPFAKSDAMEKLKQLVMGIEKPDQCVVVPFSELNKPPRAVALSIRRTLKLAGIRVSVVTNNAKERLEIYRLDID